jgi:cytosine/adenosine deaminase-related metal-dependent hydrolase
MKIKDSSRLLTADWVLPVSGSPVHDAGVLISDHIDWVGKINDLSTDVIGALRDRTHSYGHALITPGLINLHTHLDYSHLHGVDCDSALFTWMRNLLKNSSSWSPEDFAHSAVYGAKKAAEAGTTFIVDSSFTGNSAQALAQMGLRAIVGLELFGSSEAHADSIWQQWESKYEKLNAINSARQRPLITLTVAPHAPYTVAPALWRHAKNWCAKNNLKLTAHIAESSQEYEWIKEGNAELDEYLAFVRSLYAAGSQSLKDYDYLKDVRDTSWRAKGGSPVTHLADSDLLDTNTLAVHLVHASDEDLSVLQKAGATVAHCPRSNSRLRNGRAPIENFIKAQLPFAFGTDSLASADDLDIRAEIRAALLIHRAANPDFAFSDEDALKACTITAARILDRQDEVGSLEPGKKADIGIFSLERPTRNPVSALFHEDAIVKDVFVDAVQIVKNGVAL